METPSSARKRARRVSTYCDPDDDRHGPKRTGREIDNNIVNVNTDRLDDKNSQSSDASFGATTSATIIPRTVSSVGLMTQKGCEEESISEVQSCFGRGIARENDTGRYFQKRPMISPQSTISLSSIDSNESLQPKGMLVQTECTHLPSVSVLGVDSAPNELTSTTSLSESETATIKTYAKSRIQIKAVILAVFALILSCVGLSPTAATAVVEPGSVFVPGAGFSGFWYTLGRLRSIPDPSAHNYYCYSAGCLGVVATLNGFTMEEMYAIAASAQTRWQRGEISRYDVVAEFVDDLLERAARRETGNETAAAALPVMDLTRLNILTTAKNGWFGVKPSVRTPTSLESLRTMLLQTTWIPFAVGDGLWHLDHMDGGATAALHPRCEVNLALPLDLDLLGNIVNVNLGRSKVDLFYKKGLAYGL